ncbi:MAG TPA: hypothetical protein VGG39_11870 [Polyangiaceae bacterium]|jgi:hypothetical protein
MKYCPEPACPHRKSCGTPAELVDRVVHCPDCGADLVDDPVVALAGLVPGRTPGYREPGAAPLEDQVRAALGPMRERARDDMRVGVAAIAFGMVVGLVAIGFGLPGGVLAIVPFGFGVRRLRRGWRTKDTLPKDASEPKQAS